MTKAKAEAAAELADLRAKLAKLAEVGAERDRLATELSAIRARDAKRLETVKAAAVEALKGLPPEAATLLSVEAATDADDLQAKLHMVAALVGKQQPVPGGTVAQQGSGMDLAALEEARKSGNAARYGEELRKAHAKYGREAVTKAYGR
jgi:hypothetical protein